MFERGSSRWWRTVVQLFAVGCAVAAIAFTGAGCSGSGTPGAAGTSTAPRDTAAAGPGFVLVMVSKDTTGCVKFDPPVAHVGKGDYLLWLSKLDKQIIIHFKGANPLDSNVHELPLPPSQVAGAVVVAPKDSTVKFTYDTMPPSACAKPETGPDVVVDKVPF